MIPRVIDLGLRIIEKLTPPLIFDILFGNEEHDLIPDLSPRDLPETIYPDGAPWLR